MAQAKTMVLISKSGSAALSMLAYPERLLVPPVPDKTENPKNIRTAGRKARMPNFPMAPLDPALSLSRDETRVKILKIVMVRAVKTNIILSAIIRDRIEINENVSNMIILIKLSSENLLTDIKNRTFSPQNRMMHERMSSGKPRSIRKPVRGPYSPKLYIITYKAPTYDKAFNIIINIPILLLFENPANIVINTARARIIMPV